MLGVTRAKVNKCIEDTAKPFSTLDSAIRAACFGGLLDQLVVESLVVSLSIRVLRFTSTA